MKKTHCQFYAGTHGARICGNKPAYFMPRESFISGKDKELVFDGICKRHLADAPNYPLFTEKAVAEISADNLHRVLNDWAGVDFEGLIYDKNMVKFIVSSKFYSRKWEKPGPSCAQKYWAQQHWKSVSSS